MFFRNMFFRKKVERQLSPLERCRAVMADMDRSAETSRAASNEYAKSTRHLEQQMSKAKLLRIPPHVRVGRCIFHDPVNCSMLEPDLAKELDLALEKTKNSMEESADSFPNLFPNIFPDSV